MPRGRSFIEQDEEHNFLVQNKPMSQVISPLWLQCFAQTAISGQRLFLTGSLVLIRHGVPCQPYQACPANAVALVGKLENEWPVQYLPLRTDCLAMMPNSLVFMPWVVHASHFGLCINALGTHVYTTSACRRYDTF